MMISLVISNYSKQKLVLVNKILFEKRTDFAYPTKEFVNTEFKLYNIECLKQRFPTWGARTPRVH